ncbi:hypothetical protein M409DRAFT_68341 [Zasmidium cellare ATCC 36951]|uniref:Fibronectin type-III domain-containing protein n=1 Tax=Zasmidium cellare ATCC 36951 TaxID=1080233 RepID=A0A6A6CAA9_ZASCE|nr:uncharacterized protein M409DRAFT_68341 [Zasmidium cellare ATCC 36951]KAF2163773.1 hypothetical protein M409DRAFT_68341 [Zasmidium cellare ATCC 36951]
MAAQNNVKPRRPALLSLLDPVWLSRCATMLQTLAVPFAFYFKPVIVFVAMSWLFYRAYQVLNKPLEELAGLLGFDIPSEPIIDLASIKADGAIVHISLPEKQKPKTSMKFEIHLNGTVIDTLSIHETAATITGLQPEGFYVVRVSLVNNVEFSSRSAPIRFRTKPANSGDFFVISADGHETDQDAAHEVMPRVRPFRGLKDIAPASPDTIPMTREGSSTGLGVKRTLTGGRRPSPVSIPSDKHDPPHDEGEPPEGAETIQQLTERLDAVRRETDEAEKQAKEEDEEELRQKDELIKERDGLKAEAMEKERASRNLKREVNTLERQNTAAQNERTKHERLLQQKKQERQKLKDDLIRWEREVEEYKVAVEKIRQEKEEEASKATEKREELQSKQSEETAAVKALDDEIREKSTEIKKLERVMRNNSPGTSDQHEPNLVQQLQQDAEEKRQWEIQYGQMQQQYAMTVQKLEQAKRFYGEQAAYLDTLRARRRQEEAAQYTSPPATQERLPRRGDSQRSRRAQSGHSSSDSPRMAGFPITSGAFGPSMTSTASMFPSAPFLNIHNGMTISGPTDEIAMTEEEKEKLTGGAPMSPGAGAELLPADLFGDGDKLASDFVAPLPGLGSLPGLPGIPGPPTSQLAQEYTGQGPASPASASSRSPSVFASPQASQQNLAHIGSPDNAMDADRKSIRSVRSNRATSNGGAGSRFSGMFGIKQRAKTTSADDGLALGKAQSHSMPRQDQGIPGIDSNTRKRNSSISGAVVGGFGNDGSFDAPPPAASSSRRSRAFNLFSSKDKSDGWPSAFTPFGRRPTSPRPVSTHSNELPRPSFDSSRWGVDTWPSGDAASGARSSPLAFGAGWNAPQQSRVFGSRHPSRRPSAQYGASGPPEDILEDEDSDTTDSLRAARLGAIGTKPPPGSKKAEKAAVDEDVPKLNPNAKDFKSFFSSMKLSKLKEGGTSSTNGTPNPDKGEFDESPPNSRKSKDTRDTRSMTTIESSIAESSRNSQDLARTPSYTNSDAAAPSPLLGGSSAGKESFMQKLSRKSSSGKFALPTFKREKSKLDSPSSIPTSAPPTTEEEDDQLSASVSSLPRESKEVQRGSGRNWSNVLKLGGGSKKKGNETPSLSEMSMTTDEDGEAEDQTQ